MNARWRLKSKEVLWSIKQTVHTTSWLVGSFKTILVQVYRVGKADKHESNSKWALVI